MALLGLLFGTEWIGFDYLEMSNQTAANRVSLLSLTTCRACGNHMCIRLYKEMKLCSLTIVRHQLALW